MITLVGLSLPALVGGAVVVETVFAWPGLGGLAVDSVFKRDYPVIMGIQMIIATLSWWRTSRPTSSTRCWIPGWPMSSRPRPPTPASPGALTRSVRHRAAVGGVGWWGSWR